MAVLSITRLSIGTVSPYIYKVSSIGGSMSPNNAGSSSTFVGGWLEVGCRLAGSFSATGCGSGCSSTDATTTTVLLGWGMGNVVKDMSLAGTSISSP